jgi:kinesin family member 20
MCIFLAVDSYHALAKFIYLQDPTAVQTSRLTLVDLAGSERHRNTQASGERLKEAGSINKSLMVLGQCLETLRSNQRRLGQSLLTPGRSDTRDVRRALQVVPFRHSKMTEMLMDYFVGDGRVVRRYICKISNTLTRIFRR